MNWSIIIALKLSYGLTTFTPANEVFTSLAACEAYAQEITKEEGWFGESSPWVYAKCIPSVYSFNQRWEEEHE